MSPEERAAFDAAFDALSSIYEVDAFGDEGDATVNIDYSLVEKAFELLKQVKE